MSCSTTIASRPPSTFSFPFFSPPNESKFFVNHRDTRTRTREKNTAF